MPAASREAGGRRQQTDVLTEIREACEADPVQVLPPADPREQAVMIDDATKGRLSGRKVGTERRIDQVSHGRALPGYRDSNSWSPRAMWLDADERAARPQAFPGLPEGMDHALERDSSERPAK